MKPVLLVLAAGMGSRYGGVKQIDAVGLHNETLLDFSTFDAKLSGFGKAVYVIRRDIEKDFRERLFDRVARNMDAEYVFQTGDDFLNGEQKKTALSSGRKKPWGTVHALICAKNAVKAPFAVINADDYYGRGAFRTIADYLSSIAPESREHAMAGYILEKTLSKSGFVSRGVCSVRDGYLASIKEHTKIGYEGENIVSLADNKKITFTGKEQVSMNFFGFSLSAFPFFEKYFYDFIALNAGDSKAECLLPEGAGAMIDSGAGKIKFFRSQDSWFGMTYPEDRKTVKEEISKKTAASYYPEKLWEK